MTTPTRSYLKVDYELRPAKQVERRMLVDALLKLSQAGFAIREYQYTGLGSTYFVDFILFHKILGLRNMWSIEHDKTIKKRIKFNRPFKCIKIKMQEASEIIPILSAKDQHLLWLDYDDVLSMDIIEDVFTAVTRLTSGSILLVTIDVEPPGDESDGPREWRDYFEEISGRYFPDNLTANDFRLSRLPSMNLKILANAISAAISARSIEFIPLFNFLYRDGHRMSTVGGMIGGKSERKGIVDSGIFKEPYYRRSLQSKPYEIRVPRLTRKERLYLDSAMPCRENWRPRDFEVRKKDIAVYREIYRFFPSYAELLF